MTRSRKRQVDVDMEERIADLMHDYSAPAIVRELERMKEEGMIQGRVPGLRTVQRVLADLAQRDPSGPWSFADAPPLEAPSLLRALKEVIEGTDGRVRFITRAEARFITKINRAVPDLPLVTAWRLARRYVARAANGDSTEDLDAWLAFAPWRGPDLAAQRWYWEASRRGWVHEVPFSFLLSVASEAHNLPTAEEVATDDRDHRELVRDLPAKRRALRKERLERGDPRADSLEPPADRSDMVLTDDASGLIVETEPGE